MSQTKIRASGTSDQALQEEANGDLALEIYNTGNIYTVFYDKASGVIYCDESVFDKETGIIRLVTEEKTNILAEHVSQFNVDISVDTFVLIY